MSHVMRQGLVGSAVLAAVAVEGISLYEEVGEDTLYTGYLERRRK